MARIRVAALILFAAAASLAADVLTLQAAASLQGLNPFFSDVRAFNTSYTASLDVTATYRCFIGTCPSPARQLQFTLAPRESRAFDDMVADPAAFNAHDTAGGVEFEFSGSEGQLVVTSRLYSNAPFNSVGMFVPALPVSKAYANSVLTSVRHDPPSGILAGFRTNVGVFNPGDSSAVATLLGFEFDGTSVGAPLVRTVPPHSGLQISGFFETAGQPNFATQNATVVVTSTAPLFTYAAVIDNRTADPIFVVGARNDTGAVTPTPNGPTPTQTSGGPGPSPTKTKTPMMGASPHAHADAHSDSAGPQPDAHAGPERHADGHGSGRHEHADRDADAEPDAQRNDPRGHHRPRHGVQPVDREHRVGRRGSMDLAGRSGALDDLGPLPWRRLHERWNLGFGDQELGIIHSELPHRWILPVSLQCAPRDDAGHGDRHSMVGSGAAPVGRRLALATSLVFG